MELVYQNVRELVPCFDQLYNDATLPTLLSAYMPCLSLNLRHPSIKLQHNTGDGGCFPLHFDRWAHRLCVFLHMRVRIRLR